MLDEAASAPSIDPAAFVCGPTPFVESVASALVLLGYPAMSVKTERFGPTGGKVKSQASRIDGNAVTGTLGRDLRA
jgi:ferredoxin-NADP reductase